MPDNPVVIEIVGEGKTDIGPPSDIAEMPDRGVLPILVHSLCGSPPSMRVRRQAVAFLGPGGAARKVGLAKLKAYGRFKKGESHGIVFVVDTEGQHPTKLLASLQEGRDAKYLDVPTAVGVAHPCIESWLLADGEAIRKGLKLSAQPKLPANPEALPAPCKNRNYNPKTVLAGCAGRSGELSVAEKTAIAGKIRDFNIHHERCPIGFRPFADEVTERIKPLFVTNDSDGAL